MVCPPIQADELGTVGVSRTQHSFPSRTLDELPWHMMLQTRPTAARSFRLPPWPRLRPSAWLRRPKRSGAAEDDAAKPLSIPRRPLGKTGIDITILNAGTGRGQGIQRILRYAYSQGIRCFDTSEKYQSEADFKLWFEQSPEVRKDVFVVTKDLPRTPGEIMGKLEKRLAAMGTDYLDLFFVHSFGDNHSLDEAISLREEPRVQGSGRRDPQVGQGAPGRHLDPSQRTGPRSFRLPPKAGPFDAIMLQYTPWLDKDAPLNRALDACWKKGIGLISMKQVAGHFQNGSVSKGLRDDVARRVPMLAERKLTPFQGLLARDLDRRAHQLGVCFHEQYRASSPQQRRGPPVRSR